MRFRKKIDKSLGEILIERGLISESQLKQALEAQKEEIGLIGEVIVRLGFIKEEDIAYAISLQYGFPYLPLENYEISQEVVKLISKEVAQHYCLIPLDKIGNTLTVAMANPLNVEAVEDLEDMTSLDIQIFVSTGSDIRKAIKKGYLDNA